MTSKQVLVPASTAVSSQKENPNKSRNAILGTIVIAVIAAVVLYSQRASEPNVLVSGTTGKIHVTVLGVGTADGAGYEVAQQVWLAAHEYPELAEIDTEVEYTTPGGLADKYGHEERRPYIMGIIPIRNLSEVRKYESEDAYASDTKGAYGLMIGSLKYGYLFTK